MRHGRKNVIHPHRFSYERFIGPIPVGLFGLHTCDNPSCVNPEHIFAGTIKDNTDDMLRKGRNATDYNNGEDNAAAKLTNKAITQIFTSKKSAHFLAAKFGVYRTCIYKIWTRKTWAHVTKNLKRP